MRDKLSNKTMDLIQHWCQTIPQNTQRPSSKVIALTTPQGCYTWPQLDLCVQNMAEQLAQQGVVQSSVVGAIGKNHHDLVILYLACLRLGALCALIPPQSQDLIQQKLAIIQAQFIWLGEGCSALDASMLSGSLLRFLKSNVSIHSSSAHLESMNFTHYKNSNLASIVFTSGSTGVPKAVVHSASQHLASAQGLTSEFEFTTEDSWLLSLPMYHVSGLSIIWRWLNQGAQLVIGTGQLSQDIQLVTHASLVPVQLQNLLAEGKPSSLKRVLLGGAHIPLSLTETATQQGIECWVGYGMTETASNVIAKKCDGSATSGHVLPHRKVKVEDGRIYVAGETLAAGYLSYGKITPLVTDDQPWFDTKDLGMKHEVAGGLMEIEVLGRADNLFISGGENIHCEEIEAALAKHPDIQQVLVIPIVNQQYGHRPVAFLQTNKLLQASDYQTFLQPYLDKFKCPDIYYLLPEDLLSTGIKISRADLKDYYAQHLQNKIKN